MYAGGRRHLARFTPPASAGRSVVLLSPSAVAHRRHRWHRHQLRPQQMEDSHSHVPSLPQLVQPAPRPLQCINGRVHPTQRFLVHDRPTRKSQNRHISVRQQNPMRRHVCCRCGSRAQSVRPPRVGRCGGGDGGATTALRRPAVCHIREKNRRTAHLRRGYVVQSGKELPHRAASPWLRGAEWSERGDFASLPRLLAIIFRDKYSHIARLD
jgi:hypothetical protein